jgi:hypothetical protein
MLLIDLHTTTARLTVHDIVSAGTKYVSNPKLFAAFIAGLTPTADLLLDGRWKLSGGASRHFAFFHLLMHQILPSIYDVRHLDKLGGRFSLRLNRVGDFTVTTLNRRIVTFKGLPVDEATGKFIIDVEMRPEVLMALCNELLVNISELTLQNIPAEKPTGKILRRA